MSKAFFIAGVIFTALGFMLPLFFIPAVILFLAAGAAFLLRGVGNAVDHLATQQCPYCTRRIPHTARKCPYCAEWVNGNPADR